MSTVINTNIAALTAQRTLFRTSNDLSTSLQRLTSGLRINSAKDDAAGLAISERFTTQVRGYNQAIRNSGDGISVAQTAEGGLDSISSSLQRMRELAVQAANFTNTPADRAAINQEVSQLKDEVQRVASQTKFNGLNLLDGTFDGAVFQVGANVSEIIQVAGVSDARTSAIGTYAGVENTIVAGGPLTSKTIQVGGGAALSISGTSSAQLAASINALGVNNLFAQDDGSNILRISYAGSGDVVLTDFGTSAGSATMAGGTVTSNTVSTIDMSTVAGANKAILSIDAALASVGNSRAKLGATMNRFEQTISNLRITQENQQASRSRIQDADFAIETAALTRAQILQQSGMSILSQANSVPQGVLALLR
jgi:flagellin